MTSRERVLAGLRREKTDKVPFSLGFGVNDFAKRQLACALHLTVPQTEEFLQGASDLRWISPRYIGPKNRCAVCGGLRIDEWGVGRRRVHNGYDDYLEIERYPLRGLDSLRALDAYQLPSADWFDYSVLAGAVREANRQEEHAIMTGNGNLFESSWYMVGLEDMLAMLLLDPELADRLLERVTDFYLAFFERALTAAGGRIDIVFTADDIGGQNGLLLSLPLWKKMIWPHHVRLNRELHRMGAKIMYHTDGAIMEAVDQIVEMGVDILEALQFDAKGMDAAKLKDRWGDRLCFHGGVSVQSTLPFGTPEEVRRETARRIEVLGKGGGYILAPSHAIQGGTPPENILAFLEAAGRL